MAELKEGDNIPIQINLIVSHENNLPCLILKRKTTNSELIKKIISAAWLERPLVILPRFTDKVKSINTLIEKGIIAPSKEEKGKYVFVL